MVRQLLAVFNIALSSGILLSATISFLFKPHGAGTLTFCLIVVVLFAFLSLTLVEKHIKSIESINYVFGIGNILFFLGIALFSFDTSHGANAFDAAIFGMFLSAPGFLLLFLGFVGITLKIIRNTLSH